MQRQKKCLYWPCKQSGQTALASFSGCCNASGIEHQAQRMLQTILRELRGPSNSQKNQGERI